MTIPRFVSRWAGTVAAATLLAAMPVLAAAQDTQAAAWVPRNVDFIYHGFGDRYSCDGLREKIRSMLEKLGARKVEVREMPCSTGAGVPSPYPGVRVKMRVLVPASSADAGSDTGAAVEAHWQKVAVVRPGRVESGDCQLIEQFRKTFLPLFTTRNASYESSCVPYQLNLGTHLSAEVLMPPGRGPQS